MWMTRGVRQDSVDIWQLSEDEKPVLVRGNWRHPRGSDEPKRFWLPHDTVSLYTANKVDLRGQKVPDRGEAIWVGVSNES